MIKMPKTDRNDNLKERSNIAEGSISNIINAAAESVFSLKWDLPMIIEIKYIVAIIAALITGVANPDTNI